MTPKSSKPKKGKQKRATVPLAPPPHVSQMKSRKRARQVTTLFHKYTRERDFAIEKYGVESQEVQDINEKIKAMGGREAYQQASQLSTSFHSTSKWVLGCLQRNGWLYGIPTTAVATCTTTVSEKKNETQDHTTPIPPQQKRKHKTERRETRLLEVGAINTELLDASDRTVEMSNNHDDGKTTNTTPNAEEGQHQKKYRLDVRAIDLHSMHPGRIEEADFLKLPFSSSTSQLYDVIVCSMVLNCVTTPKDRGEMLARLFHFLRPGGFLFLTIPKLCLTQSPYINRGEFLRLLGKTGVGFQVEETKESPKVAFCRCMRPELDTDRSSASTGFDNKWTQLKRMYKGKKYRNQFAVILNKESVFRSLNN